MFFRLRVLALSPLLLMQGLYVRKVTPRLPEAAGARVGEAGTGPALRLMILGDSAAATTHATAPAQTCPSHR